MGDTRPGERRSRTPSIAADASRPPSLRAHSRRSVPMAVPEPANAECFSQPHWRVIARGLDVESWFDDGQVKGTGGIVSPKEIKLPVGQRYYRFASSTSPR